MQVLSWRCPHNVKKGNEHERIYESIACNLVLSISPCLGTEIPVQSSTRSGRARGIPMCDDVLSAVGM